MAWQIEMSSAAKLLPKASSYEKDYAKEVNARGDSLTSRTLFNDRYMIRSYYGPFFYEILYDTKRSNVTSNLNGKITHLHLTAKDIARKSDSSQRLVHLQFYRDSIKTISGFRCHKATYKLQTDSLTDYAVWYTEELQAPVPINPHYPIPGIVLETHIATNQMRVTIQTRSIEQVPVTDSTFALSRVNTDLDYASESKPRLLPEEAAYKKALVKKLSHLPHKQVFDQGAIARWGFLQVVKDDSVFYVDQKGDYAFDQIHATYHPVASVRPAQPGWENIERADSVTMLIVRKKGKYGLIRADSGWVLPPIYTDMHQEFKKYLSISREGKKGYTDSWGKILVPARYEQVNIMDNHYFDVSIGGKFGIYSTTEKKLILPAAYDQFDYCGGCSGQIDCAYASKDNKWGVIDFKGKVLVPFAYEHPTHYAMRGDEWVTSFEKNGRPVIINMNTQTVYSAADYEDMNITNGLLVLKKKGKYGLIGSNGQQLAPFVYDQIGDAYGSYDWGPYLQIYQNGYCGIITDKGKVVLPPKRYKHIYANGHFFGAYANDYDWVILDQHGKPISPAGYTVDHWRYPLEAIDSTGKTHTLFVIEKNGKEGFFNVETGDFVPPQFSSVELVTPEDSLASYVCVRNKDGARGLYSIFGKALTPVRYADFYFRDNGYAKTQMKDKYGLYDVKNAKEIAPLAFDDVIQVSKRYFLLKRTDSCCQAVDRLYDTQRDTLFSLPYPRIALAGDGLLLVGDSTTTYLYSLKEGKVVSQGYPMNEIGGYWQYGMKTYKHGLFEVSDGNKSGCINARGQEVVPVKYDWISINKQGIIQLRLKSGEGHYTYQYADSTGRLLSDSVFSCSEWHLYDFPTVFQYGNCLIISRYDHKKDQNLFGIMTLDGTIIAPPNYTAIRPSKNGNGFIVQRDKSWGLLDKNGTVVVPPVLDNIFTTPNIRRTEIDLHFPVLCQLDKRYFYVQPDGNILPLVTKDVVNRR